MPNPWSGPGGDEDPYTPRFAKIPRLADYQPTEEDRKAEYWAYRAKQAGGQRQHQGGRRTINVDLGGAFANAKARAAMERAGPSPDARHADAWKVYEAQIAVQKMEAAQAERDTDNARMAAHNRAMDEDRRTNQGNLQRDREADNARAAGELVSRNEDRDAALAATKDYREEMSSFRASELGRGVARDAESKRQHDENLAFRREQAANKPKGDEEGDVARFGQGLAKEALTDDETPGVVTPEEDAAIGQNVKAYRTQTGRPYQGKPGGQKFGVGKPALGSKFKTPEDVKAAVAAGMSQQEATRILKTQFGYDD